MWKTLGVLLTVVVLVLMDKLMVEGFYTYTDPDPAGITNGGNLTVSITGRAADVLGKSNRDEVRLYCPGNVTTVNNYVDKWLVVDVVANKTTLPLHGMMNVGPIINMRVPCQLRFYAHDTRGFFFRVSFQPNDIPVSFKGGPADPLQGHLAMTSSVTEMRATWVSADISDNDPSLWYMKASSSDTPKKIQAGAKTYAAGDMCGLTATTVSAIAFRDPGIIYSAVMTGLEPNTKYTYWYGAGNLSAISQKRIFTAPQSTTVAGTQTRCHIVAFADMGAWGGEHVSTQPWDSAAKSVVDLILKKWITPGQRVDLISHVGDISYALGQGFVWERFFFRVEPIATLVPYHVAIGNHEYDHVGHPSPKDPSGVEVSYNPSWGNYGNDSRGECGVPMERRFTMPSSPGSNGVFWYSHNVANVHMVVISTEHDISPGSTQARWLEQDLASVNRNTQPWVIVAGHRPLYNNEKRTGDRDLPVQEHLRTFLNPVFSRYSVNLYVCGHYHNYVRTAPIGSDGGVVTKGTVHVTVGTGGADLGSGQFNPMPWALKGLTTHGLLSIKTEGASSMMLQFIGSDMTALDSVSLTPLPIPTTPPTRSTAPSGPPGPGNNGTKDNTGLIIGVVVAVVLLASIGTILVVLYLVRRGRGGATTTDGTEPLQEDF